VATIHALESDLLRRLRPMADSTDPGFAERNLWQNVTATLGGREIFIDAIRCPRPLYLLWEWLCRRPCHGGIQLGTVRIGPPLDPEPTASGGVHGKRLPALLQSPLLRHPQLTVERISIAGLDVFLARLWLENGHLGFDLCLATGETVLHGTLDLHSLRTFLRRGPASGGSAWDRHLLRHLLTDLRGTLWFRDFPLSLLGHALPVRPQGTLDGHLTLVRGGPTGTLSLAHGRLRTPSGSLGLRDGTVHLRFLPGRVEILQAQARMDGGSGTVQLEGALTHRHWTGLVFALRGSGQNCLLLRRGGIALRGDWEGSLGTANGITTLAGNLTLGRSFWFSEGFQSALPLAPKAHSSLPPWSLRWTIGGERFLRIRSPYLRGFLSADLSLGGTLARPELTGPLTLEGAIFFPFARFTVKRGQATFDPSPGGPRWDLLAESRLLGHDLFLRLEGRGPLPPLRFSSIPSLSPGEIVALVMSGRPPGSGDEGGLPTLGVLGAYLGTGLLGRNLLDRVCIQVDQDAAESGRETIGVEYVLDEKNSIIVDYDRFDHCSVDYRRRLR
jgi:hypothetical protein